MRHLLLYILIAFFTPAPALAGDIMLLTHNFEGQAYRDPSTGELRGLPHAGKRSFNIEVVRELQGMIGHSGHIQEVTFARGMDLIATTPDTALFNVYRTPEREHSFKWVGPLQREIDYLYGLKQSNSITSLDDARLVQSICVANGTMHHTALRALKFTNIVTEQSYIDCFKKLQTGEVDLTASSEETVKNKLKEVGIGKDNFHKVPERLFESAGYIAFSKTTDDTVIRQWQAAFNQLVGSGKYEELYGQFYE